MNSQANILTRPSNKNKDESQFIRLKLEELSNLEDGWLNGEGKAPEKELLEWLGQKFTGLYDYNLLLPHIFPTLEGGVQAEWTNELYDISLKVNPGKKAGVYQSLFHPDDEFIETVIDLDNDKGWAVLNQKLHTAMSVLPV